jgi:hypothetical protein
MGTNKKLANDNCEKATQVAFKSLRRAIALRIFKTLERGERKKIAEMAGVNAITMTRFINGENDNEEIHQALLKYVKVKHDETLQLAKDFGIDLSTIE